MAGEIDRNTIRKVRWFGADHGLFLLLFYLYVWLVVDPRLVHHSLGILADYRPFSFHAGWPFLAEHLARVGGAVEYAARLLSQLYCFGWLGALIITAAAWSMCLGVDAICRRAGWARGFALRYVPAAILLVMYGGYCHPLNAVLSLLTALSAYLLFVRVAPPVPARRLLWLSIAFGVSYWLAGAGSLLFPVIVAVDEMVKGGSKRFAAGAMVLGLVVPAAALVWPGLGVPQAYVGFVVADPGVFPGKWSYTVALYLFFPTVVAGALRWGASRARDAARGSRRKRGHADVPNAGTRTAWSARIAVQALSPAFPYLALGFVAWLSLDKLTRNILEMDYHSEHEQWAETLKTADRLPPGMYNVRCYRNTMLALFHTGRLGDEMFRYVQTPSADLYFTPFEQRDLGSFYQESRLFLELGAVNHAERCAYEAFVSLGDQPAILRQLAAINAVKGRLDTARMFWKALEKHPFHRRTARDALGRLEANSALDDDPQVRRIRENMLDKDCGEFKPGVEAFLQTLLDKNSRNRLAFELLMAQYLATGRPEAVVANLPRLKDFAYPRIPRHYQEAMIVYAGVARRPLADPAGIDPEVLARYGEFLRIWQTARNAQAAGAAVSSAGLSDSYFCYFTFGVSRQ